MLISRSARGAIIAVAFLVGCSAQNVAPEGPHTAPMGVTRGENQRSTVNLSHRSKPLAVAVLVSEPFTGTTTASPQWVGRQDACMTAGTATPRPGIIPGCGSPAIDPPGHGALRLTSATPEEQGFVAYKAPLPTANGLDIQFELHSYGSSMPADGTLVWFSSPNRPYKAGLEAGSLGFLKGVTKKQTGMWDAYLGIGFDEYGNFSAVLPGGPGQIPDNVAIGGAQSAGFHYLGDYGTLGLAPYEISGGQSGTRSSSTVPVEIELTAAGNLEVYAQLIGATQPVLCYSGTIVGLFGQPAVPSSLYFGFASTTGANFAIHEITDLVVTTLN
jgi:hypothetical protein